eukprot:CAMPEP_0178928910 /NCGR_PEP_ID=MMETSP0786-20121207/20219_1 /TAXON_ID=186022 /ORGANISM="Thalassionema frauenfeldii, Strain CCMP 1798" /LENGTH=541 /DNA_ID=CAMNT_0020604933 /DNA_START=378 /DNA_END=2003 /DNA_ORIENTATION=-
MAIVLILSLSRNCYIVATCSGKEWKEWALTSMFDWSKENIPAIKKELEKEKRKIQNDIASRKTKDARKKETPLYSLPQQGRSVDDVMKELVQSGQNDNEQWKQGRVSGSVYLSSENDDEGHTNLMSTAFAAYSWSNPLHTGLWPTLDRYETEVIRMTASLVSSSGRTGNETNRIHGTMTSGGTESIMLAIKAHRDFYGTRRSIQYPELICGSTAHAAVDKACELMGIRKVVVQCDPVTFTINPESVRKKITVNTILIYASAPNYPQGTIDPISDLSAIALKYDIGLHVDACLGGFVLAFAQQLPQYSSLIPKFDFTNNPGVTSMSIDTHKYGYASKGTSVVLYRDACLRQAQYFPYANWTGGLYSTPTFAGSRPGALVACAWAALVSIGRDGYADRARQILETSQQIVSSITRMKDLHVLGGFRDGDEAKPQSSLQIPTMVVCFASDTLDIYRIGDCMEKRGWSLNALQHPASVHICVTLNTVRCVDQFLEDLKASTAQAREEGANKCKEGTAAIYGTASRLPQAVKDLLRIYTDMTMLSD